MPYSHYIIIDTETSGMPERIDLSLSKAAQWPFILQLAWLVLDKDGNLVKEECHYLKSPGVTIDPHALQLHGITPGLLKAKGVSKRGMINRLYRDIKRYNALIIGHFIEFDMKMLTVASQRLNMHLNFDGMPTYCTMLKSGFRSHNPDRQYPSLAELHQQIFNKPMKQAHHALHDARATATVFLHLLENGLYHESAVTIFVAGKDAMQATAHNESPSFLQRLKQFIFRS